MPVEIVAFEVLAAVAALVGELASVAVAALVVAQLVLFQRIVFPHHIQLLRFLPMMSCDLS